MRRINPTDLAPLHRQRRFRFRNLVVSSDAGTAIVTGYALHDGAGNFAVVVVEETTSELGGQLGAALAANIRRRIKPKFFGPVLVD